MDIYDVTGIDTCNNGVVYNDKVVICRRQHGRKIKSDLEKRLSLEHGGEVQTIFNRIGTIQTEVRSVYCG